MTTLLTRFIDGVAKAGGEFIGRMQANAGGRLEEQSVDQLISILSGQLDPDAFKALLGDGEAVNKLYRYQYVATTTTAEAVMMVDWHVEERKQTQDGPVWERADGHDLEQLLTNPNPHMTGEEFMYLAMMELLCVGKSFWRIVTDGTGLPRELWPIQGEMAPKIEDGNLVAWVEKLQTKNKLETNTYEPAEVMYLRFPKVGDFWGGMGPMQAAGSSIALDDQIVSSETAAFKNSVFPSLFLKIVERDAKKRDEVLREFREKYAAAKKAGAVIAHSEALEPKEAMSTKPREMGYAQGSERVKETTFATLRFPEALAGISKSVNKASVQGIEYIFARYNVAPRMRLLFARLNQSLAYRFWGTDTWLVYDSPVPEDREQNREDAKMELSTGAITINEYRERRGLAPVDWGDAPILPVGVAPLGTPAPAAQAQMQATLDRMADMQQQANRGIIAVRFQSERQDLEKRLRSEFSQFFADVEQEVLKAFDASEGEGLAATGDGLQTMRLPHSVDQLLDPDRLAEALAKQLKPLNTWGITLGGAFEQTVSGDGANTPWHEGIEAINAYAQRYGTENYREILTETRKRLTEAVAKGVAGNESWSQLRLRIVEEFGQMKASRAANIATTETTRLYGAGGQAFRDEYNVGKKTWIATGVNTRETHAAAAQRYGGAPIPNRELFDVGSDHMLFPGDGSLAEENCNCNCVAVGHIGG